MSWVTNFETNVANFFSVPAVLSPRARNPTIARDYWKRKKSRRKTLVMGWIVPKLLIHQNSYQKNATLSTLLKPLIYNGKLRFFGISLSDLGRNDWKFPLFSCYNRQRLLLWSKFKGKRFLQIASNERIS